MRRITIAIALILSVGLTGCGSKTEESESSDFDAFDESQPTPTEEREVRPRMTNEGALVQTPVDYIETVVRLGAHQEYRMKTMNVQNAINQYKVMEGSYPKTIEDLVEKKYFPKVPSLNEGHYWKIDPNTGDVKIMEKVARRR